MSECIERIATCSAESYWEPWQISSDKHVRKEETCGALQIVHIQDRSGLKVANTEKPDTCVPFTIHFVKSMRRVVGDNTCTDFQYS